MAIKTYKYAGQTAIQQLITKVKTALGTKVDETALSTATVGTAQNLNNLTVGSATAPVYFNGGVPTACAQTGTTGIHQIFTYTSVPTDLSGINNGDLVVIREQ